MNMRKILLLFVTLLTTGLYSQVTITSAQDGDWHQGSTWVGGSAPGSNDNAIIAHTVTVTSGNTAACTDLTINANKTLNLNAALAVSGDVDMGNVTTLNVNSTGSYTQSAGNFTTGFATSIVIAKETYMHFSNASTTLSISGNITINSDSNEFGMLAVKGSFSDPNSAAQIDYKRYMIDPSAGWELAGSPVSSLSIQSFVNSNVDIADSGSQYGIGYYTNTSEAYAAGSGSGADTWVNYTTSTVGGAGNFVSGKGYQMATDNGSEVLFRGKLTTGTVNINAQNNEEGSTNQSDGTRFTLLSNPYTTYIDVSSFLTTNSADLHASNGAIYVWDGSSMVAKNSGSGYKVPPAEGFMIGTVGPDGTTRQIDFTTSMMAIDGTDNAISGQMMDENKAIIILKAQQQQTQSYTDIYFIEEMTNGFDFLYDSEVFGSWGDNLIYSRLVDNDDGLDLAIQSLPYSEMWEKTVSLGVNAYSGEELFISIKEKTTPADLNIYLEDTEEGTMTNLLEEDFVYTPTSDLEGVGRFFIHMTADTMSNEDVSTSILNAYKEIDASYITIEGLATQSNETKVSLYNILGREVLSTTLNNNMGTQTISTVGLSAGIYVIELESGSDRLTKKLIVH